MSELNLILLGPPGAGKGTQAARLQEDFHLLYIATGNMLREAVAAGTEMGKKADGYMKAGDLVPDEVVIGAIIEQLHEDRMHDGFLLDGFPRSPGQAEALDDALTELDESLTAVLFIEVPPENIIKRLSGRRVCAEAGHPYHVDFDPPKREGVCDQDGSRLIQREDDQPETIRTRLDTYGAKTEPLVAFYEHKGVLKRFDGTRSPTEVHDHIRATLATLRLDEQI